MWEGQLGGNRWIEAERLEHTKSSSYTESKIRNTTVHTLAQGDNQVICTQYKLPNVSNNFESDKTLDNMIINNNAIISSITDGTNNLGLSMRTRHFNPLIC